MNQVIISLVLLDTILVNMAWDIGNSRSIQLWFTDLEVQWMSQHLNLTYLHIWKEDDLETLFLEFVIIPAQKICMYCIFLYNLSQISIKNNYSSFSPFIILLYKHVYCKHTPSTVISSQSEEDCDWLWISSMFLVEGFFAYVNEHFLAFI